MSTRFRLSPRLLLVAVIGLSGCGYAPESEGRGAGPGGRNQDLALSPRDELAVGRKAYRQVLDEYRDRILPENHPDSVRVNRIVSRLGKAAEIEPLQREINLRVRGYTFEWETTVVRERQINAFCLPAGKMVVFTGILPVTADDAQLAAVLSHEMAHALAHHGSERVAREQSGGGSGLGGLKYDRFQESEADKIGVFLMAFTDYDPAEAIAFWERMRRTTGDGGVPEILSDHPGHGTRIRDLRKWVPRAQAARQAFDEGRIQK